MLTQPRYLARVLATFVHALPVAYQQIEAPHGTLVRLAIPGPAGGDWTLQREEREWRRQAAVGGDIELALPLFEAGAIIA